MTTAPEPIGQASAVPTGPDPTLQRLIANVESNANIHAQRFERVVFNRITAQGTSNVVLAIQRANNCSADTARVIYSTSYGKYQEMGFNIYSSEGGYTKSIAEFLNDESAQDALYFKFIVADGINYSWQTLKANPVAMDTFALKYNGSTAYADRMKVVAKELGI